MAKQIPDLTALTSLADNDIFIVHDTSSGQVKRIQFSDLCSSQSWSPTITGFSSNPTGGVYQYTKIGKTVILNISMPNTGTSNSSTFTISLPFTAKTQSNLIWVGYGPVTDNGTVPATPGLLVIQSGGTTLSISKDHNTAFTASGNKRLVYGSIIYESA